MLELMHRIIFFVIPCDERDTDVTISVQCFVHASDLSGPKLLYLCMDFKIIWHRCAP